MIEAPRHYEENKVVSAPPSEVFAFADNPANFSSHMNKSSVMMGGSKMYTRTDEGKGQKLGSHIKMGGNVLGVNLFLDEVITKHDAPSHKEWQTVGQINLLVIDHYKLGFEITPLDTGSRLKVYIDYKLPQSFKTRWLGLLFGSIYAKWCVQQMINGTHDYFATKAH